MSEHTYTVTLEAQELRPGTLTVRARRNGVGGPFFETTDMEVGRRVVATFNAFPDSIPTEAITPGLVGEMVTALTRTLAVLEGDELRAVIEAMMLK